MIRWRAVVSVAAIALTAVAATPAAPASATSFRYWSYWTGDGDGWTFASVGPAFRAASEDTIEGWRLAVSDVQGTSRPRLDTTGLHDRACRDIPAQDGKLRIAVVVDFGTASDALAGDRPPAMSIACAVVDQGSTGFDALKASGALRTESGMVCGIDGYPSSGCGRDAVQEPSQESSNHPDRSPSAPTNTSAAPQPEPVRASGIPTDDSSSSASPPATSGESQQSPSSAIASPSTSPRGDSLTASPVATRAAAPGTEAGEADAADDSASGGPLVAGLVLVGLVLLTAMGVIRARRRR